MMKMIYMVSNYHEIDRYNFILIYPSPNLDSGGLHRGENGWHHGNPQPLRGLSTPTRRNFNLLLLAGVVHWRRSHLTSDLSSLDRYSSMTKQWSSQQKKLARPLTHRV